MRERIFPNSLDIPDVYHLIASSGTLSDKTNWTIELVKDEQFGFCVDQVSSQFSKSKSKIT